MIPWNNHPVLVSLACLAESYRNAEKAVERGEPEARVTETAVRQALDRELKAWRKAIDSDPSAFSCAYIEEAS